MFFPLFRSSSLPDLSVSIRVRPWRHFRASYFGFLIRYGLPKDFSELPKDFPDLPKDFPELPKDFSDLPKDFLELPKDFPDLPKDFSELPKDFLDLPKDFSELPKDFLDLPKDFSDLPKDFLELPKDFPDLPKDFSELPKDFSDLPKDFPELPKDFLDLPKDFSELPKDFSDLPKDFPELPKDFSDLPEDFLELPKDFLDLPKDFSELPKVFPCLPRVFSSLPKVSPKLREVSPLPLFLASSLPLFYLFFIIHHFFSFLPSYLLTFLPSYLLFSPHLWYHGHDRRTIALKRRKGQKDVNMPNEKEFESLRRLEAKIGKKLKELPLDKIMGDITNGYSCDKKGNMIGLNLWKAGTADISFLRDFPRLKHLQLFGNQITALSPLQPLINLTDLYLSDNQITGLSPLQPLINLTELSLSGNQITDLSPLQPLINLTELDLRNNQITDLSPLQPLIHLTRLDLDNNKITDISPLLPLKKLKLLDLSKNKISRLPEEWTGRDMEIKWEYDYKDGLFLKDNPLEVPPVEIVQQGDAAVRNYFAEIKRETVLLLHSKVLLVGSGAVGKTTLVKKLENKKFIVIPGQEPTTHGIHIVPWELSCTFANGESHPVKIHFWDFGGQDILYTTHQFFLTKRSLYLFVWEARQEGQETASFEYWLNIIKLLSAGSPVIIVMNKADSRTQTIDEASFKNKFPNIRAFCRVSCLTGKGMAELTELIRAGLSEMPHLQDRLPKTWLQIRDDLKKQERDYISLAEYLAICEKRNLNPERAEFVSDYLHDLGVILHFRGEPLLADTVILNPEWATSAVYKIMDTPAIIHNKGRFHYHDLKTYWDPRVFPTEKHPQLLRLMEKFELCFPVPGAPQQIHIVPELLSAQQPDMELEKYRGTAGLRFEYHYEFMPRGILSRFITRLYSYILREHYWKTGVELTLDNTFALVQSEPLNRKLTVTVTGADKSELLAIARHHLEGIHRSLNMEKDEHYREMIPCGCGPCQTAAKPHLFRREVLKRFFDKGIKDAQCQESGEQVLIDGLLKGYAPPQKTDLKELLDALITTATRLQGRAKAVKTDEDSRNTFIAEILSARGYTIKDQTRWGSSATGKRPGELDIFIETPAGNAVSVIEAFNLTGFKRGVIADHFQKIFLYDAPGLETNYIVVYVESADFGTLWRDYLSCLPEVEVKYKLQGAPQEEKTPYADIKLARTVHDRHNRETTVYHLFVNMKN